MTEGNENKISVAIGSSFVDFDTPQSLSGIVSAANKLFAIKIKDPDGPCQHLGAPAKEQLLGLTHVYLTAFTLKNMNREARSTFVIAPSDEAKEAFLHSVESPCSVFNAELDSAEIEATRYYRYLGHEAEELLTSLSRVCQAMEEYCCDMRNGENIRRTVHAVLDNPEIIGRSFNRLMDGFGIDQRYYSDELLAAAAICAEALPKNVRATQSREAACKG